MERFQKIQIVYSLEQMLEHDRWLKFWKYDHDINAKTILEFQLTFGLDLETVLNNMRYTVYLFTHNQGYFSIDADDTLLSFMLRMIRTGQKKFPKPIGFESDEEMNERIAKKIQHRAPK